MWSRPDSFISAIRGSLLLSKASVLTIPPKMSPSQSDKIRRRISVYLEPWLISGTVGFYSLYKSNYDSYGDRVRSLFAVKTCLTMVGKICMMITLMITLRIINIHHILFTSSTTVIVVKCLPNELFHWTHFLNIQSWLAYYLLVKINISFK